MSPPASGRWPSIASATAAPSSERVLDGTISGGATLNGTLLHIAQERLPFGGVGPSGIGAYHGEEGFRRFSHARSVFRVGPDQRLRAAGAALG